MSEAQAPVADDAPVMIAWKAYQASPPFQNTFAWAKYVQIQTIDTGAQLIEHPHLPGSLWAVFLAGFEAGSAHAIHSHGGAV